MLLTQAKCLSCLFYLRFRNVITLRQRCNNALPAPSELPRSLRNLV
jgi:hypothetical protein